MAASSLRGDMSSPSEQDSISIKNLQLPYGVVAPDVWGKPKEQPALVSIHLLLHSGFSTAAGSDKLDDSTIHYGNLAKRIRTSCKQDQTLEDLRREVESAISGLAHKATGKFIVSQTTLKVHLPKASMSGEGVELSYAVEYDRAGRAQGFQQVFRSHGVKIMTLLGVNSYERAQKQPLVANVSLHFDSQSEGLDVNREKALFGLEQEVVRTIQDTSFETLETLANFAVSELRKRMLDAEFPGARIQLSLEKPRAIAFAEAPAVEVAREIPYTSSAASKPPAINIIKPYYHG